MGAGGEGGEGEGAQIFPKEGLIKGLIRAYLGSLPLSVPPPAPMIGEAPKHPLPLKEGG